MIQCRVSRQSIDANRNPTITGPTTAESVPPMAWNPKACPRFCGSDWTRMAVAKGCHAASPHPAKANRNARDQNPGAQEASR